VNETIPKDLIKVHDDNDVDMKTSHRRYRLFRIDIGGFNDGRTMLSRKVTNRPQCRCPSCQPSIGLRNAPHPLRRNDIEAKPEGHAQPRAPRPPQQLSEGAATLAAEPIRQDNKVNLVAKLSEECIQRWQTNKAFQVTKSNAWKLG
jgi:hypothetical protein